MYPALQLMHAKDNDDFATEILRMKILLMTIWLQEPQSLCLSKIQLYARNKHGGHLECSVMSYQYHIVMCIKLSFLNSFIIISTVIATYFIVGIEWKTGSLFSHLKICLHYGKL